MNRNKGHACLKLTILVILSVFFSVPPLTSLQAFPVSKLKIEKRKIILPILMYHHIKLLEPDASDNQRVWTVQPESFVAQLDYLKAHEFETISFERLVGFFDAKADIPKRPIILTFDDGYLDAYTTVFPLLRDRGMTGTFFPPIPSPEVPRIKWEHMLEMAAAGMEFGSHTITHVNLTSLSPEDALRQLQVSKMMLEEELKRPVISISYPFGGLNATVIEIAKEAGYRVGVGLCCGYYIDSASPLHLPRIRVSSEDTMESFAKKLLPVP